MPPENHIIHDCCGQSHNLKFENGNGSGNGCAAAANGGGGAVVVNGKTSRKNSAPEAILNGNGNGGSSIINGGIAPKANASPSFVEELVDEK